jgi:hypothetical protein
MSTETASGRAGTFMFDRDAEAMPRRALAALQASRLKDTLERAYALAHYRQKFDAAGVRPGDFKSLADIGMDIDDASRSMTPHAATATTRSKLVLNVFIFRV